MSRHIHPPMSQQQPSSIDVSTSINQHIICLRSVSTHFPLTRANWTGYSDHILMIFRTKNFCSPVHPPATLVDAEQKFGNFWPPLYCLLPSFLTLCWFTTAVCPNSAT